MTVAVTQPLQQMHAYMQHKVGLAIEHTHDAAQLITLNLLMEQILV